ncbi:MAG: ElyC/SanA/YdcF family protein, partial [Candidatus Omnitrophota bacterium]|nr:ElyC/SanA/YdcF family protein [Candidatus Omnitrophota bacterium]
MHLFPFAVNFEKFENARLAKAAMPRELDKIPQPIIAYVGGVHKWIDIGLIEKIVVRYPRYSFVFIGPLQTDVSRLLPHQNVYFLGKKEHDKIPDFISNSSVCLIPYLLTEYTKNVYPTKLNEYLAMGKPVISTALPEVIDFNTKNGGLILVAKTCDEFMDYIPRAINDSGQDSAYKRIAVAKKNDWNARIEEMSNIIEDAIKVKSCVATDWKDNFLKLYKLARRKSFKWGFILLTIYMSVFNTPLIWFLAAPLKIAQPPIKADCIVVLAGGVGESGKAGQGYEERVQYAVELFKKGYADYIIFSSGYKFIFEEAMIMKSLAIALGIPESAIIIEDKAANTYQNVKFVKDILYQNKWGRVLLISSPYHMRRVSMVFSRIAPEMMVIYTPIPTSEFY